MTLVPNGWFLGPLKWACLKGQTKSSSRELRIKATHFFLWSILVFFFFFFFFFFKLPTKEETAKETAPGWGT